jgi:hypothetical protein
MRRHGDINQNKLGQCGWQLNSSIRTEVVVGRIEKHAENYSTVDIAWLCACQSHSVAFHGIDILRLKIWSNIRRVTP